MNMSLFLVVLVLHFSIAATVRNGIQMCKFVVFHYDEFKNPILAFTLGIFIILSNIVCEFTNLVYILDQKSVEDVIRHFVAFKILIQMQDYYMRMRSNFRIKNAVSQHPLVVKVDLKKIFREKGDDDHILSKR